MRFDLLSLALVIALAAFAYFAASPAFVSTFLQYVQ